MWASRALLVVFKTTGGKRWIPREGLPPLSRTQQRTRRRNTEMVLKNQSVLKMAAAYEPVSTPTRLYKPLAAWKLDWMKRKLAAARRALGWDEAGQPQGKATALALQPSAAFEARVHALAARLRELRQQEGQAQLPPHGGGSV